MFENENKSSGVSCVRICIVTLCILLCVCGIFAIYYGFIASDNQMYGIIGVAMELNLQRILVWMGIAFGVILFITAIMGVLISYKRYWPVHWCFALMVILLFFVFLMLGLALVYIAFYVSGEMTALCKDGTTETDLQKALAYLYMASNTIFCTAPPLGCLCHLNHIPTGGERPGATYLSIPESEPLSILDNTPVEGIYKTQECESQLLTISNEYQINSFNMSEISGYLDMFGAIEAEYNCSGICEYQSVFYFSNSSAGQPARRCYEPINDTILMKEIFRNGLVYVVTGVVLAILTCLHYGLCFRDENFYRQYDEDEVRDDWRNKDYGSGNTKGAAFEGGEAQPETRFIKRNDPRSDQL